MTEEITLCEKGNAPKIYFTLDNHYRIKRRKLGIDNNKDRLFVYIEDKALQKTLEDRGLRIDKHGKVGILKVLISFNERTSPKIILHTEKDEVIKLDSLDDANWFLYKFNMSNPYGGGIKTVDITNYWGDYTYDASKEADISAYDDIAMKIKAYDWSNGERHGTTAYLTELELYNVHLADLRFLSGTLILESDGAFHRYPGGQK